MSNRFALALVCAVTLIMLAGCGNSSSGPPTASSDLAVWSMPGNKGVVLCVIEKGTEVSIDMELIYDHRFTYARVKTDECYGWVRKAFVD